MAKGDLPIDIDWLHNGFPVEATKGVNVIKMSSRISSINIESVRASHMGNFTCVAVNKAGQADYTSELHINGYFKIVELVLHCRKGRLLHAIIVFFQQRFTLL